MRQYKLLEKDTEKMVDRLQRMKVITNFEADDISQLLIRKNDTYKHTKKNSLTKDIIPILLSLVAENKLKLHYIAMCPRCNIPIKETEGIEIMGETVQCCQCGSSYGYNGSESSIVEKFYFTSKKITN